MKIIWACSDVFYFLNQFGTVNLLVKIFYQTEVTLSDMLITGLKFVK